MIPGIDIGDTFRDRYEVYDYLGERTILALDQDGGDHEVVLKILSGNPRDAGLRRYFSETVDTIKRLNGHPNIVTLREHGWTERPGCFYLVYDYVHGLSLEQTLRNAVRHPDRSSYCWSRLIRICEALGRAHAENVAHWNINPSNILLAEGTDIPQLAHLGVNYLAHALSHGAPQPYDIYASPERRGSNRESLDHSSDIP